MPDLEPAAPDWERQSTCERRQLTVLSCELLLETVAGVGRIEPDDLRDIVGTYHRYVGAIVGWSNGFVARRIGQTALVYLGYPMAHEDDAKQAVCAGLDVCTTVSTLAPKYRLRFASSGWHGNGFGVDGQRYHQHRHGLR